MWKRFFLAAISLCAAQSMASNTQDTQPFFIYVSKDSVVARALPNGKKIASFQRDSELRVLAAGEKWHFVSGISGGSYVRGWMWADFLTPYEGNASLEATTQTQEIEGFLRNPSDVREAKALIISRDIDRYTKACPCPYSLRSDSVSCSGGSAWESPGGRRPRCYPSDVTLIDLDQHFSGDL